MWCGGVCSYSMDIWARVGNVLHCSSILHYIHSTVYIQVRCTGLGEKERDMQSWRLVALSTNSLTKLTAEATFIFNTPSLSLSSYHSQGL